MGISTMADGDETAPSDGETTTTITATTHLTLPSHPMPVDYNQLNPKSHPTEFLGPVGTASITVIAPFFAYFLWYSCNESTGCPPTSVAGWRRMWDQIGGWPSTAGRLWEWKAAGVYLAYYGFTVACWAVLPGEKVEGNLLRDGRRNTYRMNGFYTLLLSLGLTLGILLQPGGIERYTWLYDHWIPLVSASLAMSTFQAYFVYFRSFSSGELLALGGNSGVFIYDWFLGRPLNPTPPGFPSFDIKTFNEVRPGMILWILLNISCACEQYVRNGKVFDSMWLVLAFELLYTADAVFSESTILNQMDITTDGFGFMLAFGDLTWVPFSYGLQCRYLAFHPVALGPVWTAVILVLEGLGYYIFRTSNNEKADFRAGKNPKNLSFMETKSGRRLLTSGWWGRSRHPNYLGDLIMGWAWCLPCGFDTPLAYFYPVYFTVLLTHRQRRDDEACSKKYGEDWDKYCEAVKYRILPYVY